MAVIQPGLERISQLLKDVQFPWKSIHVAGTNGKGSVCHVASALLTARKIRCGKFTSPHLVDRWDCISIDDQPVDEITFYKVEKHYQLMSQRERINASPFEILTATAFHIFNQKQIEIGVIEVGMGGKLDATNILNNQVVSVISKIARDHERFLGSTVEEIARHKAGILRPNVPYIVNPYNEYNVQTTINVYANKIGAGPAFKTEEIEQNAALFVPTEARPKPQLFQRINTALGTIAFKQALKSLGQSWSDDKITEALSKISEKPNPGRLEYARVPPIFGDPGGMGRAILVDGAHNPDAAQELSDHVLKNERQRKKGGKISASGSPVTWVMAMTDGKDAQQYLSQILQPGDTVVTTSFGPVDGMPWVKPMDPQALAHQAKTVQPAVKTIHIPERGVLRALSVAKHIAQVEQPIILTGSLYLVGDFHREMKVRKYLDWWQKPAHAEDRAAIMMLDAEGEQRVTSMLRGEMPEDYAGTVAYYDEESRTRSEKREDALRRAGLEVGISRLNEKIHRLDNEEALLLKRLPSNETRPGGGNKQETLPSLQTTVSPEEGTSTLKTRYLADFDDIRSGLEGLSQASPPRGSPTRKQKGN